MKKNVMRVCVIAVCMNIFTGCMSTGTKNEEIVYTEIDGNQDNCKNIAIEKIEAGSKWFKIVNASISEYGDSECSVSGIIVNATSFIQNNPDFFKRIEFDKKYTVYIKLKKERFFLFFVDTSLVLEKIEGLRTVNEIRTEKAEKEAAAERAAEEKRIAEDKASAEKRKVRNEKASALAKGYVYHGIDESDKNAKLFDGGALEAGHAYYISSYLISAGGSMGGVIVSLFRDPHYRYVNYISQKVKGEVINAERSIFGDISVVVAGGKAPLYIPVILGVVE
ncbi:hypothetical protein [Treponema sp. SP13]|uniref:hypothetical protein n=1 Tax=Treponema sp. SP13 TaxID=2789742 RepID=UPI003D8C6D6D